MINDKTRQGFDEYLTSGMFDERLLKGTVRVLKCGDFSPFEERTEIKSFDRQTATNTQIVDFANGLGTGFFAIRLYFVDSKDFDDFATEWAFRSQ